MIVFVRKGDGEHWPWNTLKHSWCYLPVKPPVLVKLAGLENAQIKCRMCVYMQYPTVPTMMSNTCTNGIPEVPYCQCHAQCTQGDFYLYKRITSLE